MLGMEKKVRALYGDDVESKITPVVEQRETANSARAGLVIGLLAIILALGVYVALDAKMSTVVQSVADMPAKVAALDAKVTAIEGLPAKMRKQMVADRLAEMAATAEALTAGLDAEAHKAAMAKISEMAKQLKADVVK
ncbi:hypothetical protein GTA51_17315 [Desulfovibrio aerotolerans]|uniref:Uncharacterized protein n=1 Tax=Solidesulfovibrio aerotolerans TaxID=295255 RepID=A0A7C9N750_9BACT|nr:hypothetical protein [Solidesulfovibrio aerotolerans]MYL84875.1 hypothetical protein [Solidesulfovibrio aerotolerans]